MIKRTAAYMVMAGCLTGCGGGGGASSGAAPVNLVATKTALSGTDGGQCTIFALSGSDSKGWKWTGDYTLISNGITSVSKGADTETVSKSQVQFTRASNGGPAISTTSTRYFKADGTVFLADQGGAYQYTPATVPSALPDVAHVGDHGVLAHLTRYNEASDISAIDISWQIPDSSHISINTTGHYAFVGGSDSVTVQESDIYTLAPDGTPIGLTIHFVQTGADPIDITLQGAAPTHVGVQ